MTKYELFFDDDNNKFVAVNPETGEIKELDAKKPKKASTKKAKKEDESSDPQIILEDNKYVLNSAAVLLLGVEPDDRLEIKFVHGDPVIGKNSAWGTEGGNRLTKSFTVSCRGKGREELSSHGHIFDLVPGEKEGTFRMKGDKPELPKETEEIANPDDIDDLDDLMNEMEESTNIEFKL